MSRPLLYYHLGNRAGLVKAALEHASERGPSVFEADLREDVRNSTEGWRRTVCEAIEAGIDDGSIRDGVDPDTAADQLISLVDGRCTRWLAGTMQRDHACELLREALQRVLAPDAEAM